MNSVQAGQEAWLQSMVDIIVDEVKPERILLFGSRARGDARPDSDVDLLIVESAPFTPQRSRTEESAKLYRRLAGFGLAKDLLLYSRSEVAKYSASRNHVVARALKEGVLLYEQRS